MINKPLSIADSLSAAHRALASDLQKLEEASAPGSHKSLAEIHEQLGQTRVHVLEHFHFEEQNGFMEAVVKRDPRFDRAVSELFEEHRQMRDSLEKLLADTRDAPPAAADVREEIRTWIKRLRRHEARENERIQDAFCQDFTGED